MRTIRTRGSRVGISISSRRSSPRETASSNGVEAWRVQTTGRGYNQPVASNDTPGGRAQNRRVEIVITPTATSA